MTLSLARNPMRRNLRRLKNRRATLEPLDDRRMLAILVSDALSGTANTIISGRVFEDLNQDGIKNGSDEYRQGWTVYLDLDNSGTRNTDANGVLEPAVVTDVDGNFSFNHLKANTTFRVAEVIQAGWLPTTPASRDITSVLNTTKSTTFANFSGGTVTGTVWNDVDNNGIRATDSVSGEFIEPGLAGWTVYVDKNANNVLDPGEPSTITDDNGAYTFTGLAPGDHEIAELLPAGWNISDGAGFDTHQTVAVVARTTTVQDFANHSTTNGALRGTMWNDLNSDGVRATDPVTGNFTEPGLAGWTVFLDLNGDGFLTAGEQSTTTNASGDYIFTSVPAGSYDLTEVLPLGWATSPGFSDVQNVFVSAGAVTYANDFANFTALNGSLSGNIWNDINRNSVRDVNASTGAFSEPGLQGWTAYLDLNRSGSLDAGEPTSTTDANGDYSFPNLQVGKYNVQEVIPSGWEASAGYSDVQTVTVYPGSNTVVPDFANFNLSVIVPGTVSGTIWSDLNASGVRDSGEGGIAGWTVFIDTNLNGTLDSGEPSAVTNASGNYHITGVTPGTVTVVAQMPAGWRATAPISGSRTVSVRDGQDIVGQDMGFNQLTISSIAGVVFNDANKNGVRDAGEAGIAGITIYLDANNNGTLDAGEQSIVTSSDLYYTPATDEAGSYSFTHLPLGTYHVRAILPATLSSTPAAQLLHDVTVSAAQDVTGINVAAQYRPAEIHGVKFHDDNGNGVRDAGEAGMGGVTVYVDTNRNNSLDPGEPTTTTAGDGTYDFFNLSPGYYVVREIEPSGYEQTSPTTLGGVLWPSGTSNPASGNVNPTSITTVLSSGQSYNASCSITLPGTGGITNKADVFLLFDDTGSFVYNSPIVRAAFPQIIASLNAALPGMDLGFGVGRFEEYANFAAEYSTGRPFILNQPIVAASTPGYDAAIQAALNRTAPGYGGDQPETDIEALYQLVTGKGFDGNNNGTTSDSGAAGLASTQLNPGGSGDVPAFSSYVADIANGGLPAQGTIGGGGFRDGALPIILLATDTGFAYQPKGETSISGVGGLTLPLAQLTQLSRPTTPFNSGAGIQETITGLNALGALVIGLGTNAEKTLDPRQQLESIAKLTGAVNNSAATIANGTATPIAPGDPLYFEIASGFGPSVANGVVNAIQNAATTVAVDVTVRASDPRVHIINHSGVRTNIGGGMTASFDVEFVGDGAPHRFDLQFVRNGTNVVLGSIPVVIGTPIPGNGYEYEDIEDGEICTTANFGAKVASVASTTEVVNSNADAGPGTLRQALTNIAAAAAGTYTVQFALPVGSQTITPLSALPGVANPIIASLDNTQHVQVGSGATGFSWDNYASFTMTGNGSLAIGGNQTSHPAASTMTVQGGTLDLLSNAGNNVSLAVGNATGTPKILFDASQTVGNISVTANGTAGVVAKGASGVVAAQPALVNGGGDPSGYGPGDKYVIANNVTVAAGGHFDVNDGILVINNGTFGAVNAAVHAGRIFSSTVQYDASNLLGLTGLGMGDNFDLSYAGIGANNQLTITGSLIPAASDFGQQFIFKYTYIGDANLDGKVTTSDYDFVFGNLGSTTNGVTGNPVIWGDGDLNGNGVVDTTDLDNLFANLGFGTTGNVQPPLRPSTSSSGATDVALASTDSSSLVDAALVGILASPSKKNSL